MTLAEQISKYRKQQGWSQEELAERMQVSRQSVSKWESDQSTPDLEKILQLSEMFGISTDCLLKGDAAAEQTAAAEDAAEESDCLAGIGPDTEIPAADYVPYEEPVRLRQISTDEAGEYLAFRKEAASYIAAGVLLCILSPVSLILLSGLTELKGNSLPWLTENIAVGIGLVVLFLLVALAVALFMSVSGKQKPWEYMEKEVFLADDDVISATRELREGYRKAHDRSNKAGVVLCILSVLPIFSVLFFDESMEEPVTVCGVALFFVIVAIGVYLLVRTGVCWSAMEQVLQEGDYTPEKKQQAAAGAPFVTAYWLTVTGIYLAVSFLAESWQATWVIWPVAAVASGPVTRLLARLLKKKA